MLPSNGDSVDQFVCAAFGIRHSYSIFTTFSLQRTGFLINTPAHLGQSGTGTGFCLSI